MRFRDVPVNNVSEFSNVLQVGDIRSDKPDSELLLQSHHQSDVHHRVPGFHIMSCSFTRDGEFIVVEEVLHYF